MKVRKLAPNIPLYERTQSSHPEAEPGSVHDESEQGVQTPPIGQSPSADAFDQQPTAHAPVGRTLRMIDIHLIDPNPLAPREVYTPAMIRDRAEALRTQGQHDPIHVIPNPEESGRFIICDGWTRVLACKDHQVLPALHAEIHEALTLEESAWFGYQQNEERQQHCDLDRAMFYEKLIATGESATEVAKKAGISKTQMSFYRSFSKLPPDVIEIVKADPDKFGASSAYQVLKVYDRAGIKSAIRVASQFAEERHTYLWLVNQVQSVIEPRHAKQTTASRHIRYSNGFFKQRGDAIELNVVVSDPLRRASFIAELEASLAKVSEEIAPSSDEATQSSDGKDGMA